MTLPTPSIVIFDMDGTTVRHINPRLLHIVEWLDDASFKIGRIFSWLFERKAQGPIFREGESLELSKQPKLIVHRAIHKFRRKDVEQIVEPCPAIYSVLDLLKKNKVPMAIVSNGLGKGYGYDILEKFDLAKYFKVTIFREDLKKSKPHPLPLMLALERMQINTKESDVIWYIGDRHKDVSAALAADQHVKAKVIPIAYALNAAIAILDHAQSPEQVIMSYVDMHERLSALLRSENKTTKTA